MRRWQKFSLFALSELVCTKKVFYPILWFPTYSPQASSPLEHSGQRKFFTPCYLSSFFSLSARGPTRRLNSTGLAELWGGWPIEQVSTGWSRYETYVITIMLEWWKMKFEDWIFCGARYQLVVCSPTIITWLFGLAGQDMASSGCHHWVSACIALLWRLPWSTNSVKTQNTTKTKTQDTNKEIILLANLR